MRTVPLLLALSLLTPHASPAQWVVRPSPAAELWYHAMALTGTQGFGALPLYDAGYPAAVRAERAKRGMAMTALERSAGEFRLAFEADSAFEMLHFLPLAAVSASPDQLLGEVVPQVGYTLLQTPGQRATLDRFASSVRTEMSAWRDERALRGGTMPAALAAIEERWTAVAAAIAPYLARYQLTSGIILPIPGLGLDGRLVPSSQGSPALIAVQLPRDPARAADAAFFAVRELCYPAVREALRQSGGQPADRREAEQLSGRAAVRCGAMLLDGAGPELARGYQAAFLPGGGDFSSAFPIPGAVHSALARAAGPGR